MQTLYISAGVRGDPLSVCTGGGQVEPVLGASPYQPKSHFWAVQAG